MLSTQTENMVEANSNLNEKPKDQEIQPNTKKANAVGQYIINIDGDTSYLVNTTPSAFKGSIDMIHNMFTVKKS